MKEWRRCIRTAVENQAESRFREQACELIEAALNAVDPREAVRRFVQVTGDTLRVAEREYSLGQFDRVFVVGAGKASARMAAAVEELLNDRIERGLVITKRRQGSAQPGGRIEIVEAGHPTPDEAGWRAAQKMEAMLDPLGERDLVICLISGGGSALLALPAEGVELADLQQLTDHLLRGGATINEMNCVRKHLSRVKGGQLARLAHPATVVSLILSDVVGNPLDVIASGPTAPDSTTFADAWAVLERYNLTDRVSDGIRDRLRAGLAGDVPDTPKEGDPIFDSVQNVIVGSNALAAGAAAEAARRQGCNAVVLSTYVEGEAREVGKVLAAVAKECASAGRPVPRPACIVAGGETTVTVSGQGTGGRNQELALAAAIALEGWRGVAVVTLATDGGDGPTGAAGAFVTGNTVRRAREQGMDPRAFLWDNDSYAFFRALDDLVITGQTGTNVNDLTFILVQ